MNTRGMTIAAVTLALCAGRALAQNEIDLPDGAEEQIQILSMALKDNPAEASTMLRLAQVLRSVGRDGEAFHWQNLALRINPNFELPKSGSFTDGGCTPNTGPDIIVGDLIGIGNYTSGGAVNNTLAFSLGTTSCNLGDVNVDWISNNNRHPVIAQNMYRISGGTGASRIEQIGQSWLKHGFTALTQNVCCTCNGSGGSVLGIGCSDPYDASLNGTQSNLGPRFDVNAASGLFTWPSPMRTNTGNAIYKRIQVPVSDLNPANFTSPIWIAEGQYISSHDAQWVGLNTLYGQSTGTPQPNGLNNASYRRFTFTFTGNNVTGLAFSGATQREKPAILAWKDNDPGVTIVNADVANEAVSSAANGNQPIFGRLIVGFEVTNNGNGTWNYEYAIQNLNSDRSARAFTIPIQGDGVVITNAQFRSPGYHSGDGVGSTFANQINFDNTPWTFAVTPNSNLSWQTQTFAQNVNANAIRWGTLYNFRFTANVPPVTRQATLGLFKSGSAADPVIGVQGPACRWVWDLNGNNAVDFSDLSTLLAGFGTTYTFNDLAGLLATFGNTCN